MDPVSPAIILYAVAEVAVVTGSMVAAFTPAIVREETRQRVYSSEHSELDVRFERLSKNANLIRGLAAEVKSKYQVSSSWWNLLGTGSSTSSRKRYEDITATSQSDRLCRLFRDYLSENNNRGKEMYLLIRNYVNAHTRW
jgi:hypothetical protein